MITHRSRVRNWQRSANGNPILARDGTVITIFEWPMTGIDMWWFSVRTGEEVFYSDTFYNTKEDAARAALGLDR